MTAYFILVHRYPQQFKRLFKTIYEKDNCYLIHVDKRAGQLLYNELVAFLAPYSNVHMLKRQNVVWGGYSMVDVELHAMKKLLEINSSWSTYVILSGQDFPIKPISEIKNFLLQNVDTNYLLISDQKKERPNTMNRIEYYFTESATGFTGKPFKRKYLKDVIPFIGGQWKILTRACCMFLTTSKKVNRFKTFYKNTLIADESFFQTVLMNTGFQGKFSNDDKRAIIWIPDLPGPLHSLTFSQNKTKELVASGKIKLRPKTMTIDDKKFLMKSTALFGRKFDQTEDNQIIDLLEKYCTKKPSVIRPVSEPLPVERSSTQIISVSV